MAQNPIWPSGQLVAVTASDTTIYSPALRQLYVGSTGNVAVEDEAGNSVVFLNVPAGFYLTPFFVKKVLATGTTASALVGFK